MLEGGAGYDHLTGGPGADTFRLDGPIPGSTDVVADFQTGVDKVALSAMGFGVAALGAFDIVDAAAGPLHARPTLIVDTAHGVLSWDPDGTGPAARVELAHGAFTTAPGDYLLF